MGQEAIYGRPRIEHQNRSGESIAQIPCGYVHSCRSARYTQEARSAHVAALVGLILVVVVHVVRVLLVRLLWRVACSR